MSVTVNNYIYTKHVPLDVIFELIEKAVKRANKKVPNSRQGFETRRSGVPGMYHVFFNEPNGFDEEDQSMILRNRMMTLHTRTFDAPSNEMLSEDDLFVPNNTRDGIVFYIGSFGAGRETTKEICTALSFLGPVVRQDEAEPGQEYFNDSETLGLEEVMMRYNYSAYEAYDLLLGLRRTGNSDYDGLYESLRSVIFDEKKDDIHGSSSFAQYLYGDDERPTP